MDQATLLAALAAAIFFGGGLLLFSDTGSTANKRVQQFSSGSSRGSNKKSLLNLLRGDDGNSRRKQIEQSLSELEQTQKDKAKKRKTLAAKLVQANWMNVKPLFFTFVSVAIGIVVGLIVLGLLKKPMIALGAAFVVGFGVPRFILNFVISRRQKKFENSFADAMDIIVRGVKTGLPLGDCLKIIAHESQEPVAGEFLKVVEGEALGVPLEASMDRMYERMPIPEVNFFTTVLNIQRTTGGNLAESLNNLSTVLRGRKLLREKIKALSAEAKTSAIIIGALPIIVMVLVTLASPEYMAELYTTERGHKNLMIGAGMMVFGILIMRKMINFKY